MGATTPSGSEYGCSSMDGGVGGGGGRKEGGGGLLATCMQCSMLYGGRHSLCHGVRMRRVPPQRMGPVGPGQALRAL